MRKNFTWTYREIITLLHNLEWFDNCNYYIFENYEDKKEKFLWMKCKTFIQVYIWNIFIC